MPLEDHHESSTSPLDRVLDRIRRLGPRPFDEVMEAALYDPDGGFYESGGSAGRRRGDFVTSPEVGPLFGACVARALDRWWAELDRPDPFVVVEVGAGRGALARSVFDAAPECSAALRYVLVERSAALRARQRELLELHEPAFPFPAGAGPVVTSEEDLPRESFVGLVLANELLDNLPFRLLERSEDGWHEIMVDEDGAEGEPGGTTAALRERPVPAPGALADLADQVAPEAPPGGRLTVHGAAVEWLRAARQVCHRGRVVVVDYLADSPSLVRRPPTEVVRTYRGHERGASPLDALGEWDLTCDVAVDQLAAGVGPPDLDRSQAHFLRWCGIDDLVEEGRRIWTERAHLGDLEAIRARSRVTEAEALTDPDGLGAFRVLEWRTGPS